MRHASGHNYRNSSFIVDVAMGQIPRFTERISSYNKRINKQLKQTRAGQYITSLAVVIMPKQSASPSIAGKLAACSILVNLQQLTTRNNSPSHQAEF